MASSPLTSERLFVDVRRFMACMGYPLPDRIAIYDSDTHPNGGAWGRRDGYVRCTSQCGVCCSAKIFVKARQPIYHGMFAIAHEAMHVYLRSDKLKDAIDSIVSGSMCARDDVYETLCNALALTMLREFQDPRSGYGPSSRDPNVPRPSGHCIDHAEMMFRHCCNSRKVLQCVIDCFCRVLVPATYSGDPHASRRMFHFEEVVFPTLRELWPTMRYN